MLSVSGFVDPTHAVKLTAAPTTLVNVATSFHVKVDRFLLPAKAIRQGICVKRRIGATTLDQCLEPTSFAVTYDPVAREVIYRQSSDSGAITLVKGGVYQLTVFPAIGEDDPNTFHAFDGAPVESKVFEFRVSDDDPPADPIDPVPDPKDSWCSFSTDSPGASRIFTGSCGVSGCHIYTRDTAGNLLRPPMDLQLGAYTMRDDDVADVVRRTAIGHVAHETMLGEDATQVDEAPVRFGRAMPIVDAKGSAGNSYLLYKVLIGRDVDTNAWFIDDTDERERLRDAFVVGGAMPQPTALGKLASAKNLDATALEQLSRWIEAGAATPDCN